MATMGERIKQCRLKAGMTQSELADKIGVKMDEREFHCKGEFKGVHKGRPNGDDLKAAKDFAKSIIENQLSNH